MTNAIGKNGIPFRRLIQPIELLYRNNTKFAIVNSYKLHCTDQTKSVVQIVPISSHQHAHSDPSGRMRAAPNRSDRHAGTVAAQQAAESCTSGQIGSLPQTSDVRHVPDEGVQVSIERRPLLTKTLQRFSLAAAFACRTLPSWPFAGTTRPLLSSSWTPPTRCSAAKSSK